MRDSLGPTPAIRYRKRVTSISPSTNRPGINVVVDGEAAPRTYSHVVSTMPLSCLRMVDTDSCNLPYALKTALRELHYEASVKVAIKFTDRWWEPQHKGGVSTTDRPTRVVVYPSYGIGGDVATMICSYTWSQDALRLGALVHGRDSLTEELLVRLILQDLAVMHGIEYETLNQKVVDYHAWNWYANEFSCGEFSPRSLDPWPSFVGFLPFFFLKRCLCVLWSGTIQQYLSRSNQTGSRGVTSFRWGSNERESCVSSPAQTDATV
jgi:monoamine oxidase